MQPKTFTAAMWIHADEGRQVAYDVFSVTGYDISLEIIDDLRRNYSDMIWLVELPTECAVDVLIEATENEDWPVNYNWFSYRVLSWVVTEPNETNVVDEFIESIELPF